MTFLHFLFLLISDQYHHFTTVTFDNNKTISIEIGYKCRADAMIFIKQLSSQKVYLLFSLKIKCFKGIVM